MASSTSARRRNSVSDASSAAALHSSAGMPHASATLCTLSFVITVVFAYLSTALPAPPGPITPTPPTPTPTPGGTAPPRIVTVLCCNRTAPPVRPSLTFLMFFLKFCFVICAL